MKLPTKFFWQVKLSTSSVVAVASKTGYWTSRSKCHFRSKTFLDQMQQTLSPISKIGLITLTQLLHNSCWKLCLKNTNSKIIATRSDFSCWWGKATLSKVWWILSLQSCLNKHLQSIKVCLMRHLELRFPAPMRSIQTTKIAFASSCLKVRLATMVGKSSLWTI